MEAIKARIFAQERFADYLHGVLDIGARENTRYKRQCYGPTVAEAVAVNHHVVPVQELWHVRGRSVRVLVRVRRGLQGLQLCVGRQRVSVVAVFEWRDVCRLDHKLDGSQRILSVYVLWGICGI